MFLFRIILLFCYFNSSTFTILPSTGECQLAEDCPSLRKFVEEQSQDYGHLLLLNLLNCDDVYSRCPKSNSVKQFLDKVKLLPSQKHCGKQSLDSKIGDGTPVTSLTDYPWIALLRYKNRTNHNTYGCNGNLISKKYVLTAAHCVDGTSFQNKALTLSSVILGEYHIFNKTDCITTQYGDDCADEIKEIFVENYLVHPEYDEVTNKADIALIRLREEAPMSAYIHPICLPPVNLMISLKDSMWIAGWGEDATYDWNTVKMKAVFYKLNSTKCNNRDFQITEKHICAGSNDTAKTCPGDSGGPLMILRSSAGEAKYLLAGVLSAGPPCGNDLKFSIFTKVSSYVEWIVENLK